MSHKWLVAMLVLLVAFVPISFGQSNNEKDIKRAEKIKSAVARLGTGKDARVRVELKDGTKFNGYISEIKSDGFVIVDEKTGAAKELLYTQVKQAKRKNSKKGLAIVGIVVGVASIIGLIVAGSND